MINTDVSVGKYSQAVQVQQTAAVNQKEEAAAVEEKKTPSRDVDTLELSGSKDVAKMSASDRAALVQSLKDDLTNQMTRFTDMMMQTFRKQGITAVKAGDDSFWKQIASGNFTVDAKTKAEAQAAISEDGFWGVSQTSQRIFDFAAALAGDNVDKMKEYQAAVEKGFKQAGEAWGGNLPAISGQTHEAVNKLFDEYYAKYE